MNLLAVPVGLLQGLDDQGRGRGAHCDLLGLTIMILLLFMFPLVAAFTCVATVDFLVGGDLVADYVLLTVACLFWTVSWTVIFKPFQSPVALAMSSPGLRFFMISDLSFIMIRTLVVLVRGCSHIVICDQGKLVGMWK